jgi:hypothetical protein
MKKIVAGLILVLTGVSAQAELCVIDPTSSVYHVDTYIRNQSRCVTTAHAGGTAGMIARASTMIAVFSVLTYVIEENRPEPECKTEWWFGEPRGVKWKKNKREACINKDVEEYNTKKESTRKENKIQKQEETLLATLTSDNDRLQLVECPRYKRWIENGDQATKDYWSKEFNIKCTG